MPMTKVLSAADAAGANRANIRTSVNTNPIVFIITLIMWFLNAYIIIILPYDIYLSNYENQNIKVINLQNIIRILYTVIYWTIFICSWIFGLFYI